MVVMASNITILDSNELFISKICQIRLVGNYILSSKDKVGHSHVIIKVEGYVKLSYTVTIDHIHLKNKAQLMYATCMKYVALLYYVFAVGRLNFCMSLTKRDKKRRIVGFEFI
ncbi:hypothetical protein K501DRAFT_271953 [Backusella circina FSU 941]|nr:hypothetical protein K501DRAFT_271953 [Backusella circina FSU 941]